MKTVLIIAEHFPPSFAVGGKRPYRFARYLHDYGWRPIVLTSPSPSPERCDKTPHPLPPEALVERSLLPTWWPEPKGRPSDGTTRTPTKDGRASPSLFQTAKAQLQLPLGPKRLLRPWLVDRIEKLIVEHHIDALFVTSSPYYLLDLGAEVKARTNVPLCLDLRDPWSLNFLQESKPSWLQNIERSIEYRTFKAADRVLMTCEKATLAYRNLYPDLPLDRIETIYNSFDPALQQRASSDNLQSGPIDLLHFGNCYGPRKLATIIRAIAKLRESKIPGAERLRLFNLGRPAESDLDLANQCNLPGLIQWEPYVPYQEGIKRLSAAPLQLLLAYGQETLYIPAKTFDYFLSGAPTLCLSESDELCNMITSTATGFAARPNDVDAVAEVLTKVLEAASENRRVCEPNQQDLAQFSSPHTAGKLARVLDEITQR